MTTTKDTIKAIDTILNSTCLGGTNTGAVIFNFKNGVTGGNIQTVYKLNNSNDVNHLLDMFINLDRLIKLGVVDTTLVPHKTDINKCVSKLEMYKASDR